MINNEITFRKLAIFLEYMERQSITRSAESLGISAVSVHRALHTLEKELRCPLFIHKGRNLLPMASAITLSDYSKQVLELMERGIQDMRAAAGFGLKELRLGCLYSLMSKVVPELIVSMKMRCPDVEIKLIMGSNRELLTKLNELQLDAILITEPSANFNEEQYEKLDIFEDQIFLAVPQSADIDFEQPVDLQNLRHNNFVALKEGYSSHESMKQVFKIAGYEPIISNQVNDIFSLISLVQAGVGYSLVPGRMRETYEKKLTLIPLAAPYQIKQNVILTFLRSREHAPNILALTAECRMYVRKLTTA